MAEIVKFPDIEQVDKTKTQLALVGNALVNQVLLFLAHSNLEDIMEKLNMGSFELARDCDDIRIEIKLRYL
jgi:hypothetical protein